MGLTTISNGRVTAVISDKGAELQSLRCSDIEYLWQGDAKYWGKRAPVLFPFVGRCKDDQYIYAGVPYKMGQHGFARDQVFELVSAGQAKAVFRLRANETLKKVYPFDFEFLIEYRIESSALSVEYTVINAGDKLLYFSVGAHEAFRCPLIEGERFEDYRISFSANERLERFSLIDGLVSRESEPFIDFGQALPLRHEYFAQSAVVLKNVKSNRITLKSDVTGRGIEVAMDGFVNVGLWQAKDAPFICIEPWLGISDGVGFFGELPDKAGIMRVNTGGRYRCNHTITLF